MDLAELFRQLREQPHHTLRRWGFVIRSGNPASGPCTIRCVPHRETDVYELNVVPGGRDWYCQFRVGDAQHVDVPFEQPEGTMVLTFAMNGCALEVRETAFGNRFYHDADGRHMPFGGIRKFRAIYGDYAGVGRDAEQLNNALFRTGNYAPQFEHAIICIKRANVWDVFNSAVVRAHDIRNEMVVATAVHGSIPHHLGSFFD